MRGKAKETGRTGTMLRITPACAGKSGISYLDARISADHPRVCGEKAPTSISTVRARGSPPRVRGKERGIAEEILDIGITPACAGKSVDLLWSGLVETDHPRVCGEKSAHR